MALPIWTLALLVGAAWAHSHMSASILQEKPVDEKLEGLISNGSSIITQCDFEDDNKPLCGWSQGSMDDGDWTRDKVSFPKSVMGPPGGYPRGDGYYLHMLSSTFPLRGVARLRSPPIWEQGPLCLHFVYRLFGLSWGAQLRLLLQAGEQDQNQRPNTLWKHFNSQSPSWTPITVTVPAAELSLSTPELSLPRRLVFEGMRGSTTFLDIALDSIVLHRGSCNQVCVSQVCSFDTLNDLCGWSWIPTVSGAKWVQKNGSSGMPNVGPEDDFSKPGGGFYMLLDPANAKEGQKSALVSPETLSSGCLSLSFHYTLRGYSPSAALSVYAQVVGSIRKHRLFSGQPAAGWQPVSVNYTGQGALQFIIVGVFGKEPEPAVAVDEIRVAPCGETFPQCDFEDDVHPFCDWSQVAERGGEWTRGNKTSPDTASIGNSLKNGVHFIYLANNKFSQEGQNFRLQSRPFCAPDAICVEFSYHMLGLGNGTTLKLLLSSPAGSPPKPLWCQQGSQKPDWMKISITIPSGLPQPMQLILSAIRGSNMAFIVAVGFIGINHGNCQEPAATVRPSQPPDTCEPPYPTESFIDPLKTFTVSYTATLPTEQIIDLTEITVGPTGKPTVSSGEKNIESQEIISPPKEFTVPPEEFISPPEEETGLSVEISVSVGQRQTTLLKEQPTALSEEFSVSPEKQTTAAEPTEKPIMPTEEPTVLTEETIPTEKPTVPTETSTVTTKEITENTILATENLTIATEKPTIPTERLTIIPTENPTISTEKPAVLTEKCTVPTEEPTVPTEKPTEEPTVPTQKPTEKPTVSSEKPTVPTEKPTEEPTVPTQKPTEKPTVPTEKPTVPTEKPTEEPTVPTKKPTEKSTVPTEKPTVPTEKPTEEPTVPTKKPTEEPTVPTKKPTEKPTVPTKKPTEKPTVSSEKPTVPTEKPTEEPTVPTQKPTEKPTVPTEKPTVPTEKPTEEPTVPTKKPTEKSTVSSEKPTVPTEKPTEEPTVPTKKPTEKPTVPTEKPTEEPTVPTKKPTEKPTVSSEKPTVPTEKSTEEPIVPTEKPTEKPTVPTEKSTEPTVPTEKSTEEPTVPTEKSTEKPTVLTKKPTEKLTVPTEKPTVPTKKPTEKTTVPTEKSTVSSENPTVPTEKPTEKPPVPTNKTTVPIEKPTEKPTVPTKKNTEKPPVPTEKCTVPTNKITVPIEKPTEKPTVPTEKPIASSEKSTVPTEKPTEKPPVPTEKCTVPTNKTTVPIEKPTEKSTVPIEKPTVPIEKPTVPTEKPTVSSEKPTVPTEKPTEKPPVPTEKCTVPTNKTTVPIEKPTEKPTVPTEKPTVPTKKCTFPTEKPIVPIEKPTDPTSTSTVHTETPTVHTEASTVHTEKLTVPTEKPTVPTQKFMLSIQSSTKPTILMTPLKALNTSPTTTTTRAQHREMCPPNAHFERCGCLASCNNPRPSCNSHCVSGCVCNSGYLFSNNSCTAASSCSCFYNNNYYKIGDSWFSSNCSERCRCLPGSHMRCHMAHCGTNSVCQLKNGQYGCHPYGSAICSVYGDTNYLTFDGRHFRFMGKCTYILAQSCGNSTEPFFRVTAKNEGRGQEGMSCVSKVYVTLHETAVTLLKDRRVLVGGQLVTLPANPSSGVFLFPSGRFVELQTSFGVRLRWDGDQQLYLNVPSTYAGKLCGFCGNYDGDRSNDRQKPDGKIAADEEELGKSWQTAEDEDNECQKGHVSPPSCSLALLSRLSGPKMCGRLVEEQGPFSACLPHVPVTTFFKNCLFDLCNFQGMQQMLCTHLAALTETCQEAGLPVKPWRGPEFCPLGCPEFSKYTLCGKSCPDFCHSNLSGVNCRDRCTEGCQCEPGYELSGLQCVHSGQCGCMDPTRGYFKVGEQWYKPGCRQLCVCEAKEDIRCFPAQCSEHEVCNLQQGEYGCHPQGYGVCTISGDSHIETFDGALSHFLGTCTYVLTKPCGARVFESHFVVSASSEFRLGNQDTTFVSAVHVEVYKVKISMLKGSRLMLDGHRVLPPLGLLQGRLLVRLSGVFLRLSTDFGLQVRYDGNHLVEVKVPSTYAHRLCGLCGNYNNEVLDDNELADQDQPWKIREASEAGCYTTIESQSCVQKENLEPWEKNCAILLNPQGPFSPCHQVVSPKASFFNCATSQCGSKGSPLALCRSLQAYATLCASAGQVLTWRNSSVCPLRCPSGSRYTPCANPCPATCLDMFSPTDCNPALPCTEGCECQKGYILSGTSCVPLSQCGCAQGPDSYHAVGESWYSDETCSKFCSCSASNNASCHQASCGRNQQCWALDGLTRCRNSYVGVCSSVLQENYYYVSFDGTRHALGGNCSYILAMSCHYTANMPFFKITSQNGPLEGAARAFVQQIMVQAFDLRITMQKNHRVLINDTQVQLPYKDQGVRLEGEFPKQRFSVIAVNDSTQLTLPIGLIVNFKSDGSYLQIQVPGAYYKKVCGICGNYNGEQEDELLMPSDELAQNDVEFVTSWQDKEFSLNCPSNAQKAQEETTLQPETSCWQADLSRAQEQCQAAFQIPAWVNCSIHMSLEPYLLHCVHSLCRFGGLNQALCESLQAFEAACQAQGLKPHIWRNSSFCPLECPAHSSYTTCMEPCVPACGKSKCTTEPQPGASCREGCMCQPGFLLSKKLCVPESHCSCTNPEGRHLPGGQMWVSKDCDQSCMCTAGTLHCEPFSCPFGSHCQAVPQEGGSCKPDQLQQCSVFGDSHYLTFDGLLYTFPGRMTYTLLRTVSKLPPGLEPLVVEGRNHAEPRNVHTLQEVTVRIHDYVIQMQSNLQLVVNNQRMTVPFKPSKYLQVSMRGHRMYLVTSFELMVSFDGKDNAVISLPTTYQDLVQGLCGNFDKDKWNDFTTPNGTQVQDANVFGSSWEVKMSPGGLRRLPRAIREEEEEGPALCRGDQRALTNSSQACSVLLDPQGPFAACHHVVAPEPFQEHCMLALCARRDPGLREELRCRLLGGYASTCQEAGSTLGGWREHTRCALACPANTVYRSCMSPCPASCASLTAPRTCTGPCVEGCASLPGYAYSGAQSLPRSRCGCTRDGRYFQGESVVSEDCSQRCTCARPGLLLCRPLRCGPGETCTLGNLTRGCFRESPCLQNPCQNDGRCLERGNRFVCECEPGYGGDLCSEPGDRPHPPEPDMSNFVPIGLGTLVLMTALVLAQLCISSMRRRKRMQYWFPVSSRAVLNGSPKRHRENKSYF